MLLFWEMMNEHSASHGSCRVPDAVEFRLRAVEEERAVRRAHGQRVRKGRAAPGFAAGRVDLLPAEGLPAVERLLKVEAAVRGRKADHRFLPSVFVVTLGTRPVM